MPFGRRRIFFLHTSAADKKEASIIGNIVGDDNIQLMPPGMLTPALRGKQHLKNSALIIYQAVPDFPSIGLVAIGQVLLKRRFGSDSGLLAKTRRDDGTNQKNRDPTFPENVF